jgi:predicted nuclease of predicted toxin-antitoxin system
VQFLVDENLPRAVADLATGSDHQASWVGDVLHGATDRVILQRIRETGEILVTRDVRFANMVAASMVYSDELSGVVLIRKQNLDAAKAIWSEFLAEPGEISGVVVLTGKGTRRHRFR